ncbi:MAG: hypothetical protein D6682_07310 [Zetaproteobacteria bacterium]|nr:MAG: hypothetical protein D6682_07310 [Zetaproteobacteria bacterium]
MRNMVTKASLPQVTGYCVATVLLVLVVTGGFIEQAIGTMQREIGRLQQVGLQAERASGRMAYDVVQIQQFITDAALTGAAESVDEARSALHDFQTRSKRLGELLIRGSKLVGDQEPTAELRILEEMRKEVATLFAVGMRMIDAYRKGGQEAGNVVMAQFDEASDRISKGPAAAIARLKKEAGACMVQQMGRIEELVVGQGVVVGLLLVGLFVVVRRALRARLIPMIKALHAWERETMEARITHIRTSGLTGELAWALNDFGDRMEAFMRDLTASLTAASAGDSKRRMDPRGLSPEMKRSAEIVNNALDTIARASTAARQDRDRTQQFEQEVRRLAKRLQAAGEQMRQRAEHVAALAEDSSGKAAGVREGAAQAARNVETVAAAAEELSASIGEVSRQVADASGVVETAAAKGSGAVAQVEQLGQASRNITGMVEVINDIAAQTNLLALNASIEAARAGEAGRGFAVVAGEVKDLAEQTSKATDEIADLIAGIQKESDEAVAAIKEIAQIIEDFRNTFEQINLATDEQNAAASEISASVQQASRSVAEVQGHIDGVADAAAETGNASAEMVGASEQVTAATEEINGSVDGFLRSLSYNRG